MSITSIDEKLLWGRAAGLCSNPKCRDDLTKLVTKGGYTIGEMAHVIAKKEKGRRGVVGGGSDSYSNLILLCPTCHTHVDKAPEGTYSEELLHSWKAEVEELRTSKLGIRIENDNYDIFEYSFNAFCFQKNSMYIRENSWFFSNGYYNEMFRMLNRVSHYSKYVAECAEDSEVIDLIDNLYALLRKFEGEQYILNEMCQKSRLLTDAIGRTFNNSPYRKIVNFSRCLTEWLVSRAYEKDMLVHTENLKNALGDLLSDGNDEIFLSIVFDESIDKYEKERMICERSTYLIQNYT